MTRVSSLGMRAQAVIGRFLVRSNRTYLYERLVDGVNGVDATTYPVLSGLARVGPASATRLAAAIGLDRTATTRYASRLEAAGLLRRVPDARDGRATTLELTARGEAAVAAARRALAALFEDVLADWGEPEAERFVAGLERFVTALEQRHHAG